MRYRRGQAGFGGDAFTSRRSRPSVERGREDSDRHGENDDGAREALLADHAQRVREEAQDIMGDDKAIWRCRCSRSILVAVLIWLAIGLFVFTVVTRDDFGASYGVLKQQVSHGQGVFVKSGSAPSSRVVGSGKGEGGAHADKKSGDLSELPDGCKGTFCQEGGGSEAFGSILGAHNGVFGFSNCYAHTCISMLEHAVRVPVPAGSSLVDASQPNLQDAPPPPPGKVWQRLTTGMKWQCVEYARRYWMLQGTPQPAFFGSVVGAADIWDELHEVTLLDGSTTRLLKYANGAARALGGSRPRVGDLLIYPRDTVKKEQHAVFPYGHVAVIVGVDAEAGLLYIAEQNWSSQPWPAPYHNYSRTLALAVDEERHAFTVHDPYHAVQGWVRFAHYED